MRVVLYALAALVATVLVPCAAHADKRVALVIGNSDYQAVPQLPNPANDARAFAEVLRAAGFDSVVLRTDIGLDDFRRSVRDFTTQASDADVAVFYFAGHGLEVGGTNLMVPVDAKLRVDIDAEDETVSLDRVLRALDGTRRLRLVILDACRDNPFVPGMKHTGASRAVNRGLQRIETAPPDTMIAFATEPGSVAADGDGRNSPFTRALMDDVAVPGLDLRIALGKVRDDVLKATGGRQRPYVTGSLGGANAALVPGREPLAQAASNPPTGLRSLPPDSAASDFKFAASVASAAGWQAFLRAHPDGPLADLARDRLAAMGAVGEVADPSPSEPARDVDPQPPSFDCARARTNVEHIVCSTPSLAAQDRQLSDLFGRVLARSTRPLDLQLTQADWLKVRDGCATRTAPNTLAACVAAVYRDRFEALQRFGEGSTGDTSPDRRPSFDCARAALPVERLICATPQLAADDQALASLFAIAKSRAASTTELTAAQSAWRVSRNGCASIGGSSGVIACVDQAYRRRMTELRANASP